MYSINLNTLFNYALISVGFSNYNEYLKTVNTREYRYVLKRQVLAFILKMIVKEITTIEIGELLKKDHATVVYSIKKIHSLLSINDKKTVNLLNDSLSKFKELIKKELDLENKTDLKVIMFLITQAIENGMDINLEDSLSNIYSNALNFLSNERGIHDPNLWDRVVQCPKTLFK